MSNQPWLFRPDGEILERLEWMTNVITAFRATEQRIKLRGAPRQIFEFACVLSDRDRRSAENLIFNAQADIWDVPVWMDVQHLESELAAGSSSVPIDTATRAFRAGGTAAILTSPYAYELVEIDEVTPTSIELVGVTATTWPALAEVVPIVAARMPDQASLPRFTGSVASSRFRFLCTEPAVYIAATEETYRSFPVLEQRPNWVSEPQLDYIRKLGTFDPAVGPVFVDDEAGGPVLLQTHNWLLDGRTAIDDFRQWLYARCGRLTSFWMPSWTCDVLVIAPIGDADVTIDIEHCRYTDQIDQAIGRRDIRIELRDGTVLYRRITGSAVLDPDSERLTIDSALGQAVAADEVASVSFMALARLDADAVEISHWRHDVAESSLSLRSFRNDL